MSDIDPAYAVAILALSLAPATIVLLLGQSVEYALLTAIFIVTTTHVLQSHK